MSVPVAWVAVVALAALGATIVATNFGGLITVRAEHARSASLAYAVCQSLYTFGLVLGTVYSVPPFRLKVRARAARVLCCALWSNAPLSASRCRRS